MWSSKMKAKGKGQKAKGKSGRQNSPLVRRLIFAFCSLPFALCLPACRMDMQDQPKYIAYRASTSFSDGMSSRPLVEGTIPRGYLREDKLYFTGKGGGGAQGAQLPTGGTGASV